jgi:hypothetical protein
MPVTSPQAETVCERLFRGDEGSLEYVLARRWPHLIDDFDGGKPLVGSASRTVGWLDGFAPTGHRSSDELSALDILILEDWPWDLGVIGAFWQRLNTIVRAWHEYLLWNVANERTADLYYRMGTARLDDAFAFQAASDLVGRLAGIVPVQQQQSPSESETS